MTVKPDLRGDVIVMLARGADLRERSSATVTPVAAAGVTAATVTPAASAEVTAATPNVSAAPNVTSADRPTPARTHAPVARGRAPAQVAGRVSVPGRSVAIVGDRATEASDGCVRNADATAAAARERRPLADDDSANERRDHERRDNHATNRMRVLRKK